MLNSPFANELVQEQSDLLTWTEQIIGGMSRFQVRLLHSSINPNDLTFFIAAHQRVIPQLP